jgi:hypothetical protein
MPGHDGIFSTSAALRQNARRAPPPTFPCRRPAVHEMSSLLKPLALPFR